ncbi:MAG TPA: putative collagen-binding domain-containing protein [Bacteroidales bacterium]|nr:putative collagen-binding domain-containing protein [Bacteroidales bacterium]
MERRWDLTDGNKPLLAKEGVFYISYLEKGGTIKIKNMPEGLPFYWFNPKTGETITGGETTSEGVFTSPDNNPWVLIAGNKVFN